MKYLSILLLLLVAMQNSIADSYRGATLSRVATSDTGTAILWSSTGWGTAANNSCSSGTGVLAFDSTTEGGRSMLSVALAAYIAGKIVNVATSATDCLGVGGKAPVIKRIDIMDK